VESVDWRWSSERPRVAVGLALPGPQPLIGIVSLDASWEAQTYDTTPSVPSTPLDRESRRRVGLHLADWATGWLRWQTGAALDRLREYDDLGENRFKARDYLTVDSTLDLRLAHDRLALSASAGWWVPVTGSDQFGAGGLLAAWRSTDVSSRPSWSVVTGLEVASRVAPLALWAGAGTGQGRDDLLRAHPLLTGDVVTGPVFGRDVAHASFEYARPLALALAGGVSLAGFVDSARASQRVNGLEPSPFYVDAGFGLRVLATGQSGSVRIDLAHGLRGGGTTLSAGWAGRWPR
jgi:hypothetical protein